MAATVAAVAVAVFCSCGQAASGFLQLYPPTTTPPQKRKTFLFGILCFLSSFDLTHAYSGVLLVYMTPPPSPVLPAPPTLLLAFILTIMCRGCFSFKDLSLFFFVFHLSVVVSHPTSTPFPIIKLFSGERHMASPTILFLFFLNELKFDIFMSLNN